ncbi:inorganic phosphate transporter [Pajaroellobacter abortibovis]|uniref:Inorganic phosphate transporter n=1 Tax=Pajaroellobacter abortibovis TaxID=1882918 RepID=A0A1L6MXV1_9BACT|nr:inorganic phosphate transporter [Pajaroellobacter abortibovis]APS00228.1 inorganic phosphate transporter [Pajaroellobacter abortibovis]
MGSILIIVIITALLFDYINGFHDAANAVATVVSTGVLPIRIATTLAGILNFTGAITGVAVAKTIAFEFTKPECINLSIILVILLSACIWNLITWWHAIPSSSSHALIGSLAGAITAHSGFNSFSWNTLKTKVLVPLFLSPTLGFLISFFFMIILLWIARPLRPLVIHEISRCLQLVSAAMMALSHGSNDAQKSMGMLTLALTISTPSLSSGSVPSWLFPKAPYEVPTWVILACALAISLGTMAGGRKIIKTMGTKMIRITPLQGFAAETTGAVTILTASQWGIPISTTHCINACIMGVGASKRLSAVRWGVAGNIITAWVLTLPLSGLIAFMLIKVVYLFC